MVNIVEEPAADPVSFDSILFAPDSTTFLPGEFAALESIAEILKKYPDIHVVITGHTALSGTEESRLALSQERAAVVKDFLLSRVSLPEDRFLTRGLGATDPIADNTTPVGKRKNRRVTIRVEDPI